MTENIVLYMKGSCTENAVLLYSNVLCIAVHEKSSKLMPQLELDHAVFVYMKPRLRAGVT